MILVPATEADFPEIVALANLAYRGREGEEPSWNVESHILAGDRLNDSLLRDELAAKPGGDLLLWREGPTGPLLGTAWVTPTTDDAWYLGLLTVHPSRQNGGAGRALLSAAEDWVRERGGKRIRMTVLSPRETLMEWYGRRGYHRSGEIVSYPYHDERLGKPLKDDLHFVVLEREI